MSKKGKKTSEDDGTELVLNYLNDQNRPFSHKLVFENLHGKDIGLGQTKVTKILEDLADAGKINRKDRFGEVDADKLKELDEKAADLREDAKELAEEVAKLERRNRDLEAQPVNSEIEKTLQKLRKEKGELESRLEAIRSGGKKVDAKEKQRLEKSYKTSKAEWKKRKRLFSEMADQFEDGMDAKKFKKLKEDLGVETDEAAGVSPDQDNYSKLIQKNIK